MEKKIFWMVFILLGLVGLFSTVTGSSLRRLAAK